MTRINCTEYRRYAAAVVCIHYSVRACKQRRPPHESSEFVYLQVSTAVGDEATTRHLPSASIISERAAAATSRLQGQNTKRTLIIDKYNNTGIWDQNKLCGKSGPKVILAWCLDDFLFKKLRIGRCPILYKCCLNDLPPNKQTKLCHVMTNLKSSYRVQAMIQMLCFVLFSFFTPLIGYLHSRVRCICQIFRWAWHWVQRLRYNSICCSVYSLPQ